MLGHLKYRAVLFDLYRTLVDITTDEHSPRLWEKLASFLRYRGFEAEGERLGATYFSQVARAQEESEHEHPEVDVLAIMTGMLTQLGHRPRKPTGGGPDRFCEEVMHLFRVLSTQHLGLYPDTLSTLEALRARGFLLGVVSDAQRSFLVPEMRILQLEPLFGPNVVVSSDLGYHKPNPRVFKGILERLMVRPDEALYVGDTLDRDVAGARAAGLGTVLVNRTPSTATHAHEPRPAHHRNADHTIHSLEELPAWLDEH